jgi:hypothetical protein
VEGWREEGREERKILQRSDVVPKENGVGAGFSAVFVASPSLCRPFETGSKGEDRYGGSQWGTCIHAARNSCCVKLVESVFD